MTRRVVVLGASPKSERYSNQAVRLLREKGFAAVPVHPAAAEIAGIKAAPDLKAVPGPVDTVSIYVRPELLTRMLPDLIALKPGRVIFSPGTEEPDLEAELRAAGITVLEACTLVLLRTNQF